jgi:nitrate/nitrite-specific signal transduction histidine kinase
MAERAERIGATLEVISTPGHGSSVVLELMPATTRSAQFQPEAATT